MHRCQPTASCSPGRGPCIAASSVGRHRLSSCRCKVAVQSAGGEAQRYSPGRSLGGGEASRGLPKGLPTASFQGPLPVNCGINSHQGKARTVTNSMGLRPSPCSQIYHLCHPHATLGPVPCHLSPGHNRLQSKISNAYKVWAPAHYIINKL